MYLVMWLRQICMTAQSCCQGIGENRHSLSFLADLPAVKTVERRFKSTLAPSDFFFQVVLSRRLVHSLRRCAERINSGAVPGLLQLVMTGVIYPMEGFIGPGAVTMCRRINLGDLGFSDFAGSALLHMGRCCSCSGRRNSAGAAQRQVTGPNGENPRYSGAICLCSSGLYSGWAGSALNAFDLNW